MLVLRGEPGIGKSALLEYAAERSQGCRIIRVTGVEWEMELPFAGLHQLCVGLLEGVERLPAPRGEALATAFGWRLGTQPDRFLVALAALSLLSDATEERPLVCLVDDVQWLDRSSAQVLAFVARRLAAESVVLLFAEREPSQLKELAGLPDLPVADWPTSPRENDAEDRAGSQLVADRTLKCLYAHVPASVPGVVFLSGGQSDDDATGHSAAMNAAGSHPWALSFSYGRALQTAALRAWGGRPENVEAGQHAYYRRAELNYRARGGPRAAASSSDVVAA